MPDASLLVVDQDEGSRWSLVALLRECGYRVAAARSPEEGLELARINRPGLLIVDPWPRVGVWAAMIEQVRDGSGAEVLALTAGADTGSAGARWIRCLPKPCPPAELLREVERLLGGRQGGGVSATLAPFTRERS